MPTNFLFLIFNLKTRKVRMIQLHFSPFEDMKSKKEKFVPTSNMT